MRQKQPTIHPLLTQTLLREPIVEALYDPTVLASVIHDWRMEKEVLPWVNLWIPWEEDNEALLSWKAARQGGAWEKWQAGRWDEKRQLLRMWACARTDAMLTGAEQFNAHAWQGGEPYLTMNLIEEEGWSEQTRALMRGHQTVRVGPSSSLQVGKKSQENITAVNACWSDDAFLQTMERTLFPWIDNGATWEETLIGCELTLPFRQWERNRSLPLVMRGVILDPANLPEGVVSLIDLEKVKEDGLAVDVLYALGVSFFTPQVCYDWMERFPRTLSPSEVREIVLEHISRLLWSRSTKSATEAE
jgi:hypothetical protein